MECFNSLPITHENLTVRLLRDTEGDFGMLLGWLTDPQVLEYYEGRDQLFTPDSIREKFSPAHRALKGELPCLVELDSQPVGYLQVYPVAYEERLAYELSAEENIFGMDLFIGETRLWGSGLGRRTVRLVLGWLFGKCGAQSVVIDPHVDNLRALNCYTACGFWIVRRLPAHELHEGVWADCWLMQATPQSFQPSDAGLSANKAQ